MVARQSEVNFLTLTGGVFMKHFGIVTIALVLLICTSVFAAEATKIAVNKNDISVNVENVVVPINLTNDIAMTAMDLPLKFSEGATLVNVSFEGTRSEDFDFKWAKIDNDNNTVVIGLIPMVYGEGSDLEAGEGVIANLEFSVAPELEILEVETTVIDKPSHELMFVYTVENGEMKDVKPEFPQISVVLSEVLPAGDLLPTVYNLKQNAPNPFNPTTGISYDLPKASNVRMSIYNVLGQEVTTLMDAFQEAGSHSIVWNGTNNNGTAVASGMYFYRIEAGEFSKTMKMMMLK